jgi:hypothetical protein
MQGDNQDGNLIRIVALHGDEYRADLLTFLALDFDFSIPADPHQFGQTSSIILIALVHAYGQGRVGMPRVDADHRKINPTKFVP